MKRFIPHMMIGALLLGTVTASYADEREGRVARRQERQQQRIAQGVKSGSLTPKETSHIERQETGLNKEIRTDRKGNGGTLTPQEKKQVNQQQNGLSREIYRDKHNGAVQQQ